MTSTAKKYQFNSIMDGKILNKGLQQALPKPLLILLLNGIVAVCLSNRRDKHLEYLRFLGGQQPI